MATFKDKEEEIIEMMKERKLEIVGLCETRIKGKGEKTLHENYKIIYSGNEDGRHGVAIMMSPLMAERMDSMDCRNERVMGITLTIEQTKISIIQTYAPQQGRSLREKEQFYETLQEMTETIRHHENVIVMGDMNGHVGQNRDGVEHVIGEFSIGERNQEGERIIDYCVMNNMSIMNTYYKHQESHKWTWYRWNAAQQGYTERSMIDLFLTNKKNIFKDVRTIPSVSLDSDHRLVVAKLKIVKPKEKVKKKQKRFKLENLKDEEKKQALRQLVTLRKPTELELEEMNIEEQWNKFKNTVYGAAEETVGIKIKYGTKKKSTAWWTYDVKEAVKEKTRSFRKWMKTRNIEDREDYVDKRNSAEATKRAAKEDMWIKIGQDLERDVEGTRKLLYSMAKNYRKGNNESTYAIMNKTGELLTKPQEIEERWREYFQELLNVEDVEVDEERNLDIQEEQGENPNEISIEEVKEALKKMRSGKAPGDDELPIELFKAAGEECVEWMRYIFSNAWKEEKVPHDWHKAIVCPIYKKGSKTDCANYRGISLLSHVGKLYERIVEKRLRTCVEEKLGIWQYGFRPNRSTTDLVFTLKMIMEKNWEWSIDKYVAFIDLEKAFDRIRRDCLWRVLQHQDYGINSKLIRVIKSIYKNTESRVKNRELESEWFSIKTGVRQGGVLSPLLFIIYMDRCLKEVCVREDKEITLAYADDVAVVTGSQQDLQEAMTRWNDVLNREGMRMNKQKTEIMKVGRIKEECNIYIENVKLKQTDKFCYLGVLFDEENRQNIEILNRIQKYNANVSALYPILKDKNIPTKAKTIIFTTILRPVLLYGSETWTLTTRTSSQIQAAEMRVLRMIRGVTRLDRIRNEETRERLGITSVLKIIEKNKLRWYGHVQRMEDTRYARKFLEWVPLGRRPVGRPRKRWMQGVEEAAERRGRNLQEITRDEDFMDRDLWRRFVEAGH